MKKSILALALATTVFVGCKKEEAKKTEDQTQLEEVKISEKVHYLHKLEWIAYKTPDKIGVPGTFNDIELSGAKDSGNIEQDIKDATFKVVTSTVNSKDSARDEKLLNSFFKLMAGDITGKFVDFKDGKATIEITMNGVTKQKEFTYTIIGDTMVLKGAVDIIADFNGSAAFNSIHELCKDLHAGKTWTEVDINVEITKQ
ncbi:YceI family protein [Flavobacterium dauae]|uniref:YceI family protein n=1 Tax=Flavobacterium dauae TaxID=1563479 RepID=UPI00101B3B19|nr:YceI family protein [Flavobacterium dauae]WLD22653.1 YceI family protein [Flavobacterium dauae]